GSDVVDVDVDMIPTPDDGDAAAEEVFGLGRGRERGRRGDGGSDECRFHTEVPWLSDETQPKDRNSRSPDIRSGPEVGARKPHSAGFVRWVCPAGRSATGRARIRGFAEWA